MSKEQAGMLRCPKCGSGVIHCHNGFNYCQKKGCGFKWVTHDN